jgi:hypothetical protein
MYLPSSEQCGTPNSTTPVTGQLVNVASRVAMEQAITGSNKAWQQVWRRNWQDFAQLGPAAAYQVLNAPIGVNPLSVVPGNSPSASNSPQSTGSSPTPPPASGPVGVELVVSGGGSMASDGSAAGSAGLRRRAVSRRASNSSRGGAGGNVNRPLTPNEKAFVQTFGSSVTPWQTYTGPLPAQGSVGSLVYGGSPSNRGQVIGTNPPPMPNPTQGYWGNGNCPTPQGAAMLPIGEPDYSSNGGANSVAGSAGSSPGAGWALGGILVLAGLAYLADYHEKRKGRKKK